VTKTNRAPYIIGIVGGSGSGKTTFAKQLSARLAPNTVTFSQDDYYKHLPDMTPEEALVYDFDDPRAIDTHLLVEHLRAIKASTPVDAPSYDFAAHARTENARHVKPARFVLVEGLLIMADEALRAMLDIVIFIDVDADVRALRRVRRDCQERGVDLSRAIAMYLGTTKRAHEIYVEPYKGEADIIIADALDESALDVVVAKLRELE
jgi:uridine kinase